MKTFIMTSSLLAAFSLQDVVLACPEEHGPRRNPIRALDSNNDQQLSADEVKDEPFLVEKFSEIDSDKNGFLTREEMKAHRKAQKALKAKPSADETKE